MSESPAIIDVTLASFLHGTLGGTLLPTFRPIITPGTVGAMVSMEHCDHVRLQLENPPHTSEIIEVLGKYFIETGWWFNNPHAFNEPEHPRGFYVAEVTVPETQNLALVVAYELDEAGKETNILCVTLNAEIG